MTEQEIVGIPKVVLDNLPPEQKRALREQIMRLRQRANQPKK